MPATSFRLCPDKRLKNKKSRKAFALQDSLRKDRDSNPGNLSVQRFSRPPQSTTLPSLLVSKTGAKVDGLFELCKSYTHIFFIIFQSSLIINLLHRNFFIHILKDTSVFVLLLFHSSVCYALQAPLLSKKCRNRRIHFCQKGTDSKQIHSR